MTWQENSRIIVMTTREVEKGRVGQSTTLLSLQFLFQSLFTTTHKEGQGLVRWLRGLNVFATKPNSASSIPGTHMAGFLLTAACML